MSETDLPTPAPVPVITRGAPESLQSQTFIVSAGFILILAGTLVGVFLIKDMSPLQGTIAGSVVSGILSGLGGYYFAASKHPTASIPDIAATTVSTTAPTTTTTTTGNTSPHA